MRTYLTLAFFVIIFSPANAQNAWLRDGQRWVVESGIGFIPSSLTTFNFAVQGDTILTGTPCKAINVFNTRDHTTSFRFAYADGNKVYSYHHNTQQFQKIYDFDAITGDTITFESFIFGIMVMVNYVVDSTGILMIEGAKRAVQHCRFVNNPDNVEVFPLPFQIIEGAGMTRLPDPLDPTDFPCAYFFLGEYVCHSAVDGVDTRLLCYKDDEIELNYVSNCNTLLSSSDNPETDGQFGIKLFPNPVRDQFNIEFQNAGNRYCFNIKDTTGKIVY